MPISVGYELTQVSWNSRVNSLAVIYEFDLTQLKECEFWVLVNSKFMWVWVLIINFKLNSLVTTSRYGMILPKLIELRHSIIQLQKTNLVYCDPLASALLNGLQTRYGSLLELEMSLAKDAATAAISHPQFKLRWVPPAQRELFRATFVECLNVESSSVTDDVAVPAVSDDEDYGNNETAANDIQCGIVETCASSYLADPDRSLGMLHKFPLVKSVFIQLFNWAQHSLLQLRLNDFLVSADRLRLQDGIDSQIPTLKNFFCLKLTLLMLETLETFETLK